MTASPGLATLDGLSDREIEAHLDDYLDETIVRFEPGSSFASFVRRGWRILHPGEDLVWNWHLDIICRELERVPDETRELVLCVPPSFGKSMLASVYFPAWLWLRKPHLKLLCLARAIGVARRDSGNMRRVVESDWYRGLQHKIRSRARGRVSGSGRWWIRDDWRGDPPPEFQLADDTNQIINFMNSSMGSRQCAPMNGLVTGIRCDGMILDDPLDAEEIRDLPPDRVAAKMRSLEVKVETTLKTRLNSPKTSFRIIIMQRLHEDDPAGMALREGWRSVVLPLEYFDHPHAHEDDPRDVGDLLFPQRYPPGYFRKTRENFPRQYAAQYQQDPQPASGGLFEAEWFRSSTFAFDPKDYPGKRGSVILSGDLTFKKGPSTDFVVLVAIGRHNGEYFVLDIVRRRMGYVETKAAVMAFARRWQRLARKFVIEDKANGPAIIDDLGKASPVAIVGVNPKGSKYERAAAWSGFAEAGRVRLSARGEHTETAIAECASFPGTHDDIVDAIGQGIHAHGSNNNAIDRMRKSLGFLA